MSRVPVKSKHKQDFNLIRRIIIDFYNNQSQMSASIKAKEKLGYKVEHQSEGCKEDWKFEFNPSLWSLTWISNQGCWEKGNFLGNLNSLKSKVWLDLER